VSAIGAARAYRLCVRVCVRVARSTCLILQQVLAAVKVDDVSDPDAANAYAAADKQTHTHKERRPVSGQGRVRIELLDKRGLRRSTDRWWPVTKTFVASRERHALPLACIARRAEVSCTTYAHRAASVTGTAGACPGPAPTWRAATVSANGW
jgi:hypothetical protein